MNSLNSIAAAALLAIVSSSAVIANDVVPPKAQSDDQISVWVNNASLEVFVSELAAVTGRDVIIEGELDGMVSGRYNGSMVDTLRLAGEKFPVLFDLQETTLGAVSGAASVSAEFALAEAQLDDDLRQSLSGDFLPGNSVDIGVAGVVVSGHPSFVERVGTTLTQRLDSVSDAETLVEVLPSVLPVQAGADVKSLNVPAAAQVIDSAASVMLENELTTNTQTETASTDGLIKPIRWVTDIPGFDTF